MSGPWHRPRSLEEAAGLDAEPRAGGTDLMERRHSGLASGPLMDLGGLAELRGVEVLQDGRLRAGALTTVAELASHPVVRGGWPLLADCAGALATPAVRAVGTLGGNLRQQVRCWYYRNPDVRCLKRGGATCLAREGDASLHSCFQQGPCLAPHPSSLAVALLALGAAVELDDGEVWSLAQALGTAGDPTRRDALPHGALLRAVLLPPPPPGQRHGHLRIAGRSRAEWPLVEVAVTLWGEGVIEGASVVLGGVAPRPLERPGVVAALVGRAPSLATFQEAAALADQGADPVPDTAFKLPLCRAAVLGALEATLPGGGA